MKKIRDNTSIIVPTLNQAHLIRETIQELHLIQKKHPCIKNIIITDTNSTDNTTKKVLETIIAIGNPSIQLLTNNPPTNREKAITHATTLINTPNTIILTSPLLVTTTTILKQIKLLRKYDVIQTRINGTNQKITGYKNKKILPYLRDKKKDWTTLKTKNDETNPKK